MRHKHQPFEIMKTHRRNRPTHLTSAPPRRHRRPLCGVSSESKIEAPKLALKKILVPTDFSGFSTKALAYAVAFAAQSKAEIILLHVVEPMFYPTLGQEVPMHLADFQEDSVKLGRKQLLKFNEQQIADRVPTKIIVGTGSASSVIVDTAKSIGADLIIIATHGHTGLKHVLLGSTAERVVRYAICPVLTVRGQEPA